MKQSKLLTKFYRAWDDQLFKLNSGKKTKYWFDPLDNLASSLEEYLTYIDKGEKFSILCKEMENQIKKSNLDIYQPFSLDDDSGEDQRNINMRRWVKKHLSRDVKTKFKLK